MFSIFKVKPKKVGIVAGSFSEVDSWTVSWKVYTGWSQDTMTRNKVFTNENLGREFEKQLLDSAKFIKAYISVDMYKN